MNSKPRGNVTMHSETRALGYLYRGAKLLYIEYTYENGRKVYNYYTERQPWHRSLSEMRELSRKPFIPWRVSGSGTVQRRSRKYPD